MKIQERKDSIFGPELFEIVDDRFSSDPLLIYDIYRTKKTRILQIDGGGIRGLMPAYILANIERVSTMISGKFFNCMYGTSTGSIIVTLLSLGWTAYDILYFYVTEGPKVFQKNFFFPLFGDKYSVKYLRDILKKFIGTMTFHEAFLLNGVELNIMAVDIIQRDTVILNHKNTPDMMLVDAIIASISGPVYFGPQKIGDRWFYDGGTGIQNNSSVKAFNQAYFVEKVPIEDIFLFSLGTGRVPSVLDEKKIKKMSLLDQFMFAFDFIRDESVEDQEHQLEYRRDDLGLCYIRWNVDLPKSLSDFDKTDNIPELVGMVDNAKI